MDFSEAQEGRLTGRGGCLGCRCYGVKRKRKALVCIGLHCGIAWLDADFQ